MIDKDGGPAFPSNGTMGEVLQEGMSLRDYFAGQAMAGILGSGSTIDGSAQISATAVARIAYQMSDAMLVERQKEKV